MSNSRYEQYEDEQRECRDCGETYTWEAGEKRYYNDRSLLPPTRCPACRQRRRAMTPGAAHPRPTPQHPTDNTDPTMRWDELYPTKYRTGGRQ